MAHTSPDVVEMPVDPGPGTMPTYSLLLDWTRAETEGLTDAQLDYDDTHPDREWMWWSIRRQVSHIAWDALVFTRRRCGRLLWPDGNEPSPIDWDAHRLGPKATWDRVLDETKFWALPELFEMMALGNSWLTEVVTTQPTETLRSTVETIHGNHFWAYVITTLPRGAELVDDPPGHIRYTLEGSLWMVFYEQMTHIRTIQRLKEHQGLPLAVELPRVGYLRLPEYWGEVDSNGPSMRRL